MGGIGGLKRTGKGLITEFANQLSELDPGNSANAAAMRYRQGITPDPMPEAASADLPENVL